MRFFVGDGKPFGLVNAKRREIFSITYINIMKRIKLLLLALPFMFGATSCVTDHCDTVECPRGKLIVEDYYGYGDDYIKWVYSAVVDNCDEDVRIKGRDFDHQYFKRDYDVKVMVDDETVIVRLREKK